MIRLVHLVALAALAVAPCGAFAPRMASSRALVRAPSSSIIPPPRRAARAPLVVASELNVTPTSVTAQLVSKWQERPQDAVARLRPRESFLLSSTAGVANVVWGLLALAAGVVNAACLLGAVGGSATGVSHVTGSSTKLGMALAGARGGGLPTLGVLAYFAGADAGGAALPSGAFDRANLPRYGRVLVSCAALLAAASAANVLGVAAWPMLGGLAPLLLAAASCGLQNALATTATTCVVRPTHMTGVTTDLGILAGRALSRVARRMPEALTEFEQGRFRVLTVLYSGFVLGCAGGAALVRHAPRLPPLLPAAAVQLTLGVLALRKAKKN